jgi:hypothetical protein
MRDSPLILEEIGIELSEGAVCFTWFPFSMIIRSECEEEIVSVSDFKNDLCPFWRCESIEFYTHHTLVDEMCDICLQSCYTIVFSPTEVWMSDRDNSAHTSDDATRLSCSWFVFWYFDNSYRIASFSRQTLSHKSESIRHRCLSLLITICERYSVWCAVDIRRDVSIIETQRIVSFTSCPVLQSCITQRISMCDELLDLLTNFLSFPYTSSLKHCLRFIAKFSRIGCHVKSDFPESSKKMCRNLTGWGRLNASCAKLFGESFTHEVMISERGKFNSRRDEIFEYLFWRIAPIREGGMEMEISFHKRKFRK